MMDATKKHEAGSKAKKTDDQFGSNSEIARKLRSYYGSLVSQDVPDRFTDLLSKLESAEAEKKKD